MEDSVGHWKLLLEVERKIICAGKNYVRPGSMSVAWSFTGRWKVSMESVYGWNKSTGWEILWNLEGITGVWKVLPGSGSIKEIRKSSLKVGSGKNGVWKAYLGPRRHY